MTETYGDAVYCSSVGDKQWMFDPRLADVVNQLAHFFLSFDGTRDSILMNIDCMCWAGKNGNL